MTACCGQAVTLSPICSFNILSKKEALFLFHREEKLRLRVQDRWRECRRDSVLLPAAGNSDLRASGHPQKPASGGSLQHPFLTCLLRALRPQDLRTLPLGSTPVCCSPRRPPPGEAIQKWPDCPIQGPGNAPGWGQQEWGEGPGWALLPLCCVTLGTSLPSLSPVKRDLVDWLLSSFLLALPLLCL